MLWNKTKQDNEIECEECYLDQIPGWNEEVKQTTFLVSECISGNVSNVQNLQDRWLLGPRVVEEHLGACLAGIKSSKMDGGLSKK